MKIFFITLVIVVAILEIVGDILFKEWTIKHQNLLLVLGVISYTVATLVWALSLQYQDLSKAIVIFAVLTLVVGVFVGVFIYKEELTTLNIAGVILGLLSIILLEI